MKKILHIGVILAFLLALVPAGASAHMEDDPQVVDLLAGQDTDVGDVLVWNDGDNLYIQYVLDSPWCLAEVHLEVATSEDDMPQTRSGNPQPGQFAVSDTFDAKYLNCTMETEVYEFPLGDVEPGDDLVIAAHAVVVKKGAENQFCETEAVTSRPGIDAFGPIDHYAALDSSDWGTANGAVATWVHPSWPNPSTLEATWVSTAEYVEDPVPDSWRKFGDTLSMPESGHFVWGDITVATSDNAEEFYFNGELVGSDGEVQGDFVDDREWATLVTYPIDAQKGDNDLEFIVRNYGLEGANEESNPTGLLYRARAKYCPEETAWADGDRFVDRGNWATYFAYEVQEDALVFAGWDAARGGTYALPAGSGAADARNALLTAYPDADLLAVNALSDSSLGAVDVLVLSTVASDSSGIAVLSTDEQDALADFVIGGGCAILFPDNSGFAGGGTDALNESLIDPFGLDITGNISGTNAWSTTGSSPVIDGVGQIIGNYSGWFDGTPDFNTLATLDANSQPGLLEKPPAGGAGRVVVFSDANVFFGDGSSRFSANETLWENTLASCFE
jgi:hypothetical protein